tara:strand:+ start:81 stop:668 length:588 start_codon:yes stop_codon:yes gene_type:complete
LIREVLEDSQSSVFDSFQYIPATNWNEGDLRNEYVEEVESSLKKGKEYFSERWPAVDVSTLSFMTDEDEFVKKAVSSPVVNLPIEALKDIYNHDKVHKIVEMYKNGATSQEIKDTMLDDFSKFRTDPNPGGKTYPKESSYLRWIDRFSTAGEKFSKPPILLSANNQLMHIGGATRQTAALTNKKILPYLILSVEE